MKHLTRTQTAETTTAAEEARARAARRKEQGESEAWAGLVAAIRAGLPEARETFKEEYRKGVRLFFRRQIGPVGLPQFVEEALEGALREIGNGQITHAADLVNFFRNLLEREQLIRDLSPNPSLAALATATDHARIRRQASFIEQALHSFSPREQNALRAYYNGEIDVTEAATQAGLSVAGFSRLRECLYHEVRALGMRKMPGRTAATPEANAPGARALAAGSGA